MSFLLIFYNFFDVDRTPLDLPQVSMELGHIFQNNLEIQHAGLKAIPSEHDEFLTALTSVFT